MAIVSLPVAPRRALTGHLTLRRPAQQGLRRDSDESRRFANPIPLLRGWAWHPKTQTPADPKESVLKLRLQALPNHRPRVSVGKLLELRDNASMGTQQTPVRGQVQRVGPGNELSTQMSQHQPMSLLRVVGGGRLSAAPSRPRRSDHALTAGEFYLTL